MERVFDLLDYTLKKYNKDVALAGKKGGKWVKYSSKDYLEYSNNVSYGLLALGIKKDDKIATITNNRPEWNFVDMGLLQIGAVHVPVYPTINDNELVVILNETSTRIIFVANKFLYNKVKKILPSTPSIEKVYTFDNIEDAENFSELIELGKKNIDVSKLEYLKSEVKTDDLASIIYTSGTTTTPKGVMLTHKNHVSNFMAAAPTLNMSPDFVSISYLPLCHVYERMINYMHQSLGFPIYYAESLASIVDNIKDVKPHVFASVPLLLEKIYANILSKGSELKGFKKRIFFWALKLTESFDLNKKQSLWYRIQLSIADKLVYKKWRAALGGNTQRIICGAAALHPKILKAFWAAKIPVHEGYGLTETSPLISVNHYGKLKFGSVGQILDNVSVKISDDGEILCKGPNVMKGYYKNPEQTAKVIDKDGWFHTGDIGELDGNNFLTITGRKKDIFKTSSGIYVSPETVEGKLKLSPFINQVIVVGANQSFLSSVIVPDFDYLQKWCSVNNVKYNDDEEIIKTPLIIQQYQKEIDEYNEKCSETERILKFKLSSQSWTIESGELTPKMSFKRSVVTDKYNSFINEFYS